ncbi:MAG: hypothetical protein QM704_26205 [Anaeromyxobacteraceae bacterium]
MRSGKAASALLLTGLAACGGGVARVELDPPSLRLGVRGQVAKVHASPRDKNGKSLPASICAWRSSDEKVATVRGANDAEITAAGPGEATVTCAIGDAKGEVTVLVRVVSKVTASPARVELQVLDEPKAFPVVVEAFDDAGARVVGRHATSHCASEDVCRGDSVPQLWPVGAGDTTAFIQVEGARSEPIAVHVVDARSAAAKPKRVTGNPMEAYEKEYQRRLKEQQKR